MSVAAPEPVRLPPRRAAGVFVAAAMLIIVATWAASGFALWRGRLDVLNDWRFFLSNLSNVTAQHADQTVAAADAVLHRVVADVAAAGPADAAQLRTLMAGEAVFRTLRRHQQELPQLDVLSIVTIDGDLVNFSRSHPAPPINVADRDYLRAHRADPALEVYLSQPVRSRGAGKWTFYLVRKLRSPQGETIGLALAGIESAYFERFYESVDVDQGDLTVALLRRDGTLLARYPHRDDLMGQSLREGASFRLLERSTDPAPTAVMGGPRTTDPGDRSLRVLAPRASQAYPLMVTSVATEALVLRHWRTTAWMIGTLTLVMDLVLAGVTAWLFVLTRRRRQVMEQLDQARAAAEQANRAKTAFLANMSHEVRTPMNGVLGMTELLLHGPLDARQRELARAAHSSGQAMLRLLNDILEVSSIEAGTLQPEPSAFDLRALLAEEAGMFRGAAERKGVALRWQVDEQVPAQLRGDAKRLRRVITHLLGNAIKFTERGEVSVQVRHLGREEGGHRLSLEVRDSGPGIAPETLAHLFLPFQQADGSMARRHTGSGLGLALTRQLVRLMGGTVSAHSEPGRGCLFRVELTLAAA